MARCPRRILLQALLALLACTGVAARAAELTVSAAASLSNAFQDIAPLFESAHPGHKLRFNFAASGPLLQQMVNGAPVDVFVSADQETMNLAQAKKLVQAATRRNIASNSLVVIVPAGRSHPPRTLNDLALPTFARVALGLPASVPAGRYTRAVLEGAGLWTAIEPKMIGAQNVRQVLDYVARGEVDAGFVYATDAALMPGKFRLAFTVPTPTPILYPAAPIVGSANAMLAQRFVDFLVTPPAQVVLARYGFGKP